MFKRSIVFSLIAVLAIGFLPFIGGETATPAPAEAQSDIEIRFVHIFGDENDIRGQVVNELVEQFMAEHENITVIVETEPIYDDVFERVRLNSSQGTQAHVVQLDESATRRAIDLELFVSITELATEEQQVEMADFLPPVASFYTVGDEMWSLPWNSSNPVLYYNKNIFESAGVESPPRTFDEVLSVCETIMSSDAAASLDGCINWPMVSWFAENWLAMQGALLVDNGNGREGPATEVFFTSEEMLLIVNWWKEMADKGYYNYTGVVGDYNGEGGAFITQKYAMHINSTAGVSNFEYYAGILQYELGVAPLPRPYEDATSGVVNGGASLWITSGHPQEELEAARDFAFFLSSAENIAEWHRNTGYFPNRAESIDILEAENFWDENPFYYIAVEQLLNTESILATSGAVVGPSETLRAAFVDAIRAIIDSGASPEDALSSAKEEVDLALYDYSRVYE